MNILLVEDSVEVRVITEEYLLELGHDVVPVADAELALAAIENGHFDIVMTDVSLPGMSGIDLAKAVIRRTPPLPVLIASGYGTLNLQMLLGPDQSNIFALPKPYDLATLEDALARATSVAAAK